MTSGAAIACNGSFPRPRRRCWCRIPVRAFVDKAATLVLPVRDAATGEHGQNDRLILNMKADGALEFDIQRA